MNLGDVRESVGNALYRQVGRASSQIQKTRSLSVDLLENGDSYLIVFDAPGARKEDVQVRYVGGAVRIRVDRFREFRDGFEMRFPGRSMALDGEISLPRDAVVDPDAGTAWLTGHGTLHVEIPKEAATETDERAAAEDTPGDGAAATADEADREGARTDADDDGLAVDDRD